MKTPHVQLLIALLVVALASAALPWLVEPADATGAGGEQEIVGGGWTFDMNRKPPEVLFLGNSLVEYGIDVPRFQQSTGRSSRALWAGGSAGGWWYTVLDHVIARAERRPGLIVLCFQDDSLTRTSLANGQQAVDRVVAMFDEEDRRAGAADRVADSAHSPAVAFLERHWSLVALRSPVRKRVESAVKGYVASLVGETPAAIDARLTRTFDLGAKDAAVLDSKERSVVDLRLYDFHRIKDHSFLPDLLEVARANQIPMVFVRMPRKDTPARQPGSPAEVALDRYIADLERHLDQHGFDMIDLSRVGDLDRDDFEAGDHLNPAGREIFMPLLEAALEPYLPTRQIASND
jgi:hypothetical protein